jgi:DNA invertase Pin-like site-specific DNA recombinase
MPTAYLYERWSTEAQTEGDSARRQLAAAERYVAQHPGLALDRKSTWRDAGISAFRSGNLKEGTALSTFLRAVESKKIAKGSYLLIENLDRLSRAAPLNALNALQRLLSLGVYVVTLHDGKRYDATSLASEDITDFLTAVLHAHRAHSESVVKSKRVREALKAKRTKAQESQVPLGAICPSWLQIDKNKERYIVRPDRARVVRTIFDWTASGLGNTAVAKRLNRSGVKVISGRASAWSAGGVGQLVTSRTVIGEYAPHRTEVDPETGKRTRVPDGDPVPGMYPQIIPAALFLKVQRDRQKRRNPSGPRGAQVSNLFTGLLRCQCGAPIHLLTSRRNKVTGEVIRYLTCAARTNGSRCRVQAWLLRKTEPLLLALLSRVIPWGRLLPQARSAAQEQLAALVEQDASLQVEQTALADKVSKVVDAIAQVGVSPALKARLTALELQAATLKGTAEDVRGRVVEARAALASARETVDRQRAGFAAWKEGKLADEESRTRLSSTLRELVRKIELRKDRRLGITLASGEEESFVCADDLRSVVDTEGEEVVTLGGPLTVC